MTREMRSTAAAQPERASGVDRLRAVYRGVPLGRRLVAALVVLTVVAVVAFVLSLPVLTVLVGTLLLLAAFSALMRSLDALLTVLVSVVWLLIAVPLFQIPCSGSRSSCWSCPCPRSWCWRRAGPGSSPPGTPPCSR